MTKAIHTKTQEQYDKVMEIFEKKWWKWCGWGKPASKNNWNEYRENTCIRYEDKFAYHYIDWYKEEWYEIISYEDFLKEEWIVIEKKIEKKIETNNWYRTYWYQNNWYRTYWYQNTFPKFLLDSMRPIDWTPNKYLCSNYTDEYLNTKQEKKMWILQETQAKLYLTNGKIKKLAKLDQDLNDVISNVDNLWKRLGRLSNLLNSWKQDLNSWVNNSVISEVKNAEKNINKILKELDSNPELKSLMMTSEAYKDRDLIED